MTEDEAKTKTLAIRSAAVMSAAMAFGGGRQILAMDTGREPARTYYPPSQGDQQRMADAEAKRQRKAAKRLAGRP